MELGFNYECMSISRGICTTALGTSNHELEERKSLHTDPPTGTILKQLPFLVPAWTIAELTRAAEVKPDTNPDSVNRTGFIACCWIGIPDFAYVIKAPNNKLERRRARQTVPLF